MSTARKRLLSVTIPTLVSLITAEATLRLFDIFPPPDSHESAPAPWLELDPHVGWKNRPGSYVVRFQGNNADNRISIEPDGSRAQGTTTPSHPRSLVLLGDSYVFGYGVSDDETVAAKLTAIIPGYTVVNRGVAGYGTANIVQQICAPDRQADTRPSTFVYLLNSFHTGRNIGDVRHIRSTTIGLRSIPVIESTTGGGFEIRPRSLEPAPADKWNLRLFSLGAEFLAALRSLRDRERALNATIWAIGRLRSCIDTEKGDQLVIALGDGDREILHSFGAEIRRQDISTIDTTLPSYSKDLRIADGHPNAEGQQRLATELAAGLEKIRALR